MFATASQWSIVFDGRYNRARARQHQDAAEEFAAVADTALSKHRLRAFVESAFAAAELLAKAELLALPDKALLRAGHGTIASSFNLWARLGNTEQRFADLLNELTEARAGARYLRSSFELSPERARELMEAVRDFVSHVRERLIEEVGAETRPRGYNLIAHRELRAGEPVPVHEQGALHMLRPVGG